MKFLEFHNFRKKCPICKNKLVFFAFFISENYLLQDSTFEISNINLKEIDLRFASSYFLLKPKKNLLIYNINVNPSVDFIFSKSCENCLYKIYSNTLGFENFTIPPISIDYEEFELSDYDRSISLSNKSSDHTDIVICTDGVSKYLKIPKLDFKVFSKFKTEEEIKIFINKLVLLG